MSYIDHQPHPYIGWLAHSYLDQAMARLTWIYGAERAWAIHKGQDQRTNEDIAAWRAIGWRGRA